MISGVYSLAQLQQAIDQHPKHWRPLVFTNGCFDLIHVGHVRYLTSAKALGRSLIVGVNSDRSVQQLKPQPSGCPARPIIPDLQRAEVVAALKPVDAVVIFSELTACRAIATLKPDMYVKGGDYDIASLPEAPTVAANHGKIHLIPIDVQCSTSAIIQSIALPQPCPDQSG
jgi:rfaE bifunctional protein nucleotidyltransferase chain/domain